VPPSGWKARYRSDTIGSISLEERAMKNIICLLVLLSLAACSTCKSSDSAEVCRTKQRDRDQARP
jgi:hypothetical protein